MNTSEQELYLQPVLIGASASGKLEGVCVSPRSLILEIRLGCAGTELAATLSLFFATRRNILVRLLLDCTFGSTPRGIMLACLGSVVESEAGGRARTVLNDRVGMVKEPNSCVGPSESVCRE
jgi:hypothetical protein